MTPFGKIGGASPCPLTFPKPDKTSTALCSCAEAGTPASGRAVMSPHAKRQERFVDLPKLCALSQKGGETRHIDVSTRDDHADLLSLPFRRMRQCRRHTQAAGRLYDNLHALC